MSAKARGEGREAIRLARSAARGFERLSEAAHQAITLLPESDLKFIARAIYPQLEEVYCDLIIFDAHQWTGDAADLPPSIDCLHQDNLAFYGRMKPRLMFYRAEMLYWQPSSINHDIRLVLSFPRANQTHCWLDCETGLPWLPLAVQHARRCFAAARQAELRKQDELEMQTAQLAWLELRKVQVAA